MGAGFHDQFAEAAGGRVTDPNGVAPDRYVYYPGTEELDSDEIRMTACGTGMPAARRGQAASCFLIELANGDKFLFDLGTGSMANIASLMIPMDFLTKVFLSHLHTDHWGDLAALWAGDRTDPLTTVTDGNSEDGSVKASAYGQGQTRGLQRSIVKIMHLTQREIEKLMLHQAGELAAKRLQRGVKLNYVECVGYISSEIMEQARDGEKTVSELMEWGTTLLSREQVMEGVPEMISNVQIEALFPDGNKLVTIHDPIR